jgi:hypothetical protein
VTLLYLVVRRLKATDWFKTDVYVGDPLPTGTWHYHHIFPNERFDGARVQLRQAHEDAQEDGNERETRRVEEEKLALEARVVSLGNLAFVTPETNCCIGHRSPLDYLREIASTKEGRVGSMDCSGKEQPGLTTRTIVTQCLRCSFGQIIHAARP